MAILKVYACTIYNMFYEVLYIVFVSENESITAFRCLGLFLRTKKRGEALCEDNEDVPFLMCQAPVRLFDVTSMFKNKL